MGLLKIRPHVMVPTNENWLYRDAFNQVWLIRPTDDRRIPFTVELYETLDSFTEEEFFDNIRRKSE